MNNGINIQEALRLLSIDERADEKRRENAMRALRVRARALGLSDTPTQVNEGDR